LSSLGRQDEAVKTYDQAIQLNPDDPDNWVARGQALREMDSLNESIKAFDRAIKINPKESSYYRYKGSVLSSQGRWYDAIRNYDLAIQLKPDDPDIWVTKGQVFREMGNLSESLKAFDQAIKLNPKEPSYYRYKGRVLASMGRQDEAMRANSMAIQGSNNVIFTSGAKNEKVTKSVEAKDTIEIKGKIAETTNNSIKDTARNVESKKQPDFGGLLTTICILVAYLTFYGFDKRRLN
jgi:tetratricopeptide (TPR) repeat protein